MPGEAVSLDLSCSDCGGAVTVQTTDWPPDPQDDRPLYKATWRCPYCHRTQEGGFPGRFAWVAKRLADYPNEIH